MLCEYEKEAVTAGLLAALEQHKFIVLVRGMRDIMSLSRLNLLNVSMQIQSLPFSMLKVFVNATREGLKREWIDLSAPPHPMLASKAFVTGGESFKRLVEQTKSGALDEDESDDKTFKLVSSGGKKDWKGEGPGGAGEANDPCAGFVQRARRGSEADFELFQGCEEEPER
jgi:hypothetical protein